MSNIFNQLVEMANTSSVIINQNNASVMAQGKSTMLDLQVKLSNPTLTTEDRTNIMKKAYTNYTELSGKFIGDHKDKMDAIVTEGLQPFIAQNRKLAVANTKDQIKTTIQNQSYLKDGKYNADLTTEFIVPKLDKFGNAIEGQTTTTDLKGIIDRGLFTAEEARGFVSASIIEGFINTSSIKVESATDVKDLVKPKLEMDGNPNISKSPIMKKAVREAQAQVNRMVEAKANSFLNNAYNEALTNRNPATMEDLMRNMDTMKAKGLNINPSISRGIRAVAVSYYKEDLKNLSTKGTINETARKNLLRLGVSTDEIRTIVDGVMVDMLDNIEKEPLTGASAKNITYLRAGTRAGDAIISKSFPMEYITQAYDTRNRNNDGSYNISYELQTTLWNLQNNAKALIASGYYTPRLQRYADLGVTEPNIETQAGGTIRGTQTKANKVSKHSYSLGKTQVDSMLEDNDLLKSLVPNGDTTKVNVSAVKASLKSMIDKMWKESNNPNEESFRASLEARLNNGQVAFERVGNEIVFRDYGGLGVTKPEFDYAVDYIAKGSLKLPVPTGSNPHINLVPKDIGGKLAVAVTYQDKQGGVRTTLIKPDAFKDMKKSFKDNMPEWMKASVSDTSSDAQSSKTTSTPTSHILNASFGAL